jgi:transposase
VPSEAHASCEIVRELASASTLHREFRTIRRKKLEVPLVDRPHQREEAQVPASINTRTIARLRRILARALTLSSVTLICLGQAKADIDVPRVVRNRTIYDFSVSEFQPSLSIGGEAVRYGGVVLTLARHPRDPQELTIATAGGLFRSNDGGRNWRHLDGLPTNFVSSVAYDPSNPERMLATSAEDWGSDPGGGVWRSTDRGETWSQPSGGKLRADSVCNEGLSAHAISYHPFFAERAYVATGCGILITGDGGLSWSLVAPSRIVTGFSAVLALSGNRVVAGGTAGVFVSSDRGSTWMRETSALVPPMTSADMHGLSRSAFLSQHVFAAVGQSGLFESWNDGRSWRALAAPTGGWAACGGTTFVKAARTPTSDIPDGGGSGRSWLRLFVGDRCGLFHKDAPSIPGTPTSFDYSGEWVAETPCHPDTHDLLIDGGRSSFLATDAGIERRSTLPRTPDCWAGSSGWEYVGGAQSGLGALAIVDVAGQQILDTAGAQRRYDLYIGTMHNRLWASTNNGVLWDANQIWEGGAFALHRRAQETQAKVTFNSTGNFISSPGFVDVRDWRNPNATNPWGNPVLVPLAAEGSAGRNYVQHGYEGDASRHGVFLTRDGNASWRSVGLFAEDLSGAPVLAGSTDPVVYQGIRIPSGMSSRYGLVQISAPFSTTPSLVRPQMMFNETCTPGTTDPRRVNFAFFARDFFWYPIFAADPANPSHLIAADSTSQKVVESFDGGDCWRPVEDLTTLVTEAGARRVSRLDNGVINAGLMASGVSAISFNPDVPDQVLVGTEQSGLFYSGSRGAGWRPIPNTRQITSIKSIHWQSGDTALVGSYGRGLWKVTWSTRIEAAPLLEVCRILQCRVFDLVTNRVLPYEQAVFDGGALVLAGRIQDLRVGPTGLEAIATAPGAERFLFDKDGQQSPITKVKLATVAALGPPQYPPLTQLKPDEVPVGVLTRKLEPGYLLLAKEEVALSPPEQAPLVGIRGRERDYLDRPSVALLGGSLRLGYPVFEGSGELTVVGRGFRPGQALLVAIDRAPAAIFKANAKGGFRRGVRVAPNLGRHLVQIYGVEDHFVKVIDSSFYAVAPAEDLEVEDEDAK